MTAGRRETHRSGRAVASDRHGPRSPWIQGLRAGARVGSVVHVTSRARFAEVNLGDPLYRDLQLRGYNRRFVGTPARVLVVDGTDQVVNAVEAAVTSGQKLAVRSGGHCTEGLVDDPAVRCVIDLGQMDSVY